VFGVIVANEQLPGGRILVGAVVATVVLSIFAHGLSANPLSARFAASEET
jgi:NhaP-type Na+/H+ or K+/H+ antiporter